MGNKAGRILVTRTDRMGDVMMALPTVLFLKNACGAGKVDFLVNDTLVPLLSPFFETHGVKVYGLSELSTLQKNYYTTLLMLFPDWKVFLKLAPWRFTKRIGPISKPWTFLGLNGGMRQKRSQSKMNEMAYNIELAKLVVGEDRSFPEKIQLFPPVAKSGNYVVVHPGMGGSALNLSANQYVRIIQSIQTQGKRVVLSIGPGEEDQKMKKEILHELPHLEVRQGLSLLDLKDLFLNSQGVIAPSTGPLHLAHYLGKETWGFFPPVLSQHVKRWEPMGGMGKSHVYFPQVDCPGTSHCIGKECQKFNCMDELNLNVVLLNSDT